MVSIRVSLSLLFWESIVHVYTKAWFLCNWWDVGNTQEFARCLQPLRPFLLIPCRCSHTHEQFNCKTTLGTVSDPEKLLRAVGANSSKGHLSDQHGKRHIQLKQQGPAKFYHRCFVPPDPELSLPCLLVRTGMGVGGCWTSSHLRGFERYIMTQMFRLTLLLSTVIGWWGLRL